MNTSKIGGMAFTGCMFVGMGVGFLINNLIAGMFIGMGVGFAFSAVIYLAASETFQQGNKPTDRDPFEDEQ